MTTFYTTWQVVIGCQIRRARIASKMSQGRFAKRMGLSQSAWSRIEAGHAPIPAHRLVEITENSGLPRVNIPIPAIELACRLKGFGVDVLTKPDPKPDPKRRELAHWAIYGLLYPKG